MALFPSASTQHGDEIAFPSRHQTTRSTSPLYFPRYGRVGSDAVASWPGRQVAVGAADPPQENHVFAELGVTKSHRIIRSNPRYESLPVIAMTANGYSALTWAWALPCVAIAPRSIPVPANAPARLAME